MRFPSVKKVLNDLEFRRRRFMATNTPKNYDDPVAPESCPKCGSRIVRDGDYWLCDGLANRQEVEKYLSTSFSKNKVPEDVTSKEPCGWSGLDSEWGTRWV